MDPLKVGKQQLTTEVPPLLAQQGSDLLKAPPKEDDLEAKVHDFVSDSRNISRLLDRKPVDPQSRFWHPAGRVAAILGGGALIVLGVALVGVVAGSIAALFFIPPTMVVLLALYASLGLPLLLIGGSLGAFYGIGGGGFLAVAGILEELAARNKFGITGQDQQRFEYSDAMDVESESLQKEAAELYKSGHIEGEKDEVFALKVKVDSNLSPEQQERFLVRFMRSKQALNQVIKELKDPDSALNKTMYDDAGFQSYLKDRIHRPKKLENISNRVKYQYLQDYTYRNPDPKTVFYQKWETELQQAKAEADLSSKVLSNIPVEDQKRFLKDRAYLDNMLPDLIKSVGLENGFKAFTVARENFHKFWHAEMQRIEADRAFLPQISANPKLSDTDKAQFAERFTQARELQLAELQKNHPRPWLKYDSAYHDRTSDLLGHWQRELQHATEWAGKALSVANLTTDFPALADPANAAQLATVANPKSNYFERVEAVNHALLQHLGSSGLERLPNLLKKEYTALTTDPTPWEVVLHNKKACKRFDRDLARLEMCARGISGSILERIVRRSE